MQYKVFTLSKFVAIHRPEDEARVRHQIGGTRKMPSISMFYGIIIYMYFVDNRQHHVPGFMSNIRHMRQWYQFQMVNYLMATYQNQK